MECYRIRIIVGWLYGRAKLELCVCLTTGDKQEIGLYTKMKNYLDCLANFCSAVDIESLLMSRLHRASRSRLEQVLRKALRKFFCDCFSFVVPRNWLIRVYEAWKIRTKF